MSYSSAMIANFFIKKYKAEYKDLDRKAKLDQLKLIKLVYIAHGWYLATFDKELINEPVIAWKYGPVIYDLWLSVKYFGLNPIHEPIPEQDIFGYLNSEPVNIPDPDNIDEETKRFLESIWRIYKNESGAKLANWTHIQGSPWYNTWEHCDGKNKKNLQIDNMEIKRYFKGLMKNVAA